MAKPTETTIHPETGAVLRRDRRPVTVSYMGRSKTVKMNGWFPEDDGDAVFVGDDLKPYGQAMKALKAAHQKQLRDYVKAVRVSVGLSQRKASQLLTGSPNSFFKYENGKAEPSRPTMVLLKLLAANPKLIENIERLDQASPK
jgi:HTH-type transcriptional regulator / antitoxin MqsA